VTDKFKDLWRSDAEDPFEALDPDGAAAAEYLHADMATVVKHLNPVGKVWVRLLQLRCMRPRERRLLLGQRWFTQNGVSRFARSRALRKIEQAGDIRVDRTNSRNPRVEILDKRRRRRRP
jgi:hypothetical protein